MDLWWNVLQNLSPSCLPAAEMLDAQMIHLHVEPGDTRARVGSGFGSLSAIGFWSNFVSSLQMGNLR